jgi:L-alanine-DL-glutamate epimerase-like enolase superfamily enzyme
LDTTIQKLRVSAYKVPTVAPESDGTLEWAFTVLVLVELEAQDTLGIGYTYASPACVPVIRDTLFPLVKGRQALAGPALWHTLRSAVRNLGQPGIAAMAIAAVDIALWDLRARILQLPMVHLLGQVREAIPAYGSGGFTSYSPDQLCAELETWMQQGISMVKIKVGRQPDQDPHRVEQARSVLGANPRLFVDANGAYHLKQALAMADAFVRHGVTWFEEPRPSDDLEGLRFVRHHAPAPLEIAAGEYGHDAVYFRRMLEAGGVDVLQADATRCGGITGFLQAGTLCEAFQVPLSAHTAPSLHQHPCCALGCSRHVEYFADHVRIEQMFFDGAARAREGLLRPDPGRPGLGLEFKHADAHKYML